ncbi:hypothetical protein NSPZN2_40126 [Nitrospira defluvii]|uniref:Uncharacterized protein n=1 Tax=Nitrospira defluvii TaxID=330214 RepID=A0ABM8RRJ1_9BACT|nr:hypothetical protein NSPZN2_40126 [Nitrospira defluvii]
MSSRMPVQPVDHDQDLAVGAEAVEKYGPTDTYIRLRGEGYGTASLPASRGSACQGRRRCPTA